MTLAFPYRNPSRISAPAGNAVEQQGGGAALAAGAVRGIKVLPGGIQGPKKKTMLRIG